MKGTSITVPVHRVDSRASSPDQDFVAVEEPLQIRLDQRDVAIAMRTPGNDAELAAGFLFTEGILRRREQIAGIESNGANDVTVSLSSTDELDLERLDRHFYMTSSCGVCGKASIEALYSIGCAAPPRDIPKFARSLIHELPGKLRPTQKVFDRTGGLHAAALFDSQGTLLEVREDVGRHNAVDKAIGASLLAGRLPLHGCLLFVSGRASFELVQKALMAGIPILAAVGAPSSLAVETALRFGMTLIGFVRDGRFNVYSGHARIEP